MRNHANPNPGQVRHHHLTQVEIIIQMLHPVFLKSLGVVEINKAVYIKENNSTYACCR